jgi:hypothetical protein
MTMALSAKNKLQFVYGTLPHPSTLNRLEFRAWKRCMIQYLCGLSTLS